MSLRLLFGSDWYHAAPTNPDGGIDLFKTAMLGMVGYLWDHLKINAQWWYYDPTMHLVWIFWCLDMLAGLSASMVRGLKPPYSCDRFKCHIEGCVTANCPNKFITGFKAFSPELARIGCARLLFWSALVWSCCQMRTYINPVAGLAAGTVEMYCLIALFCSFWRNLSRLAGDKRGERAAASLEDKADRIMGIHNKGG